MSDDDLIGPSLPPSFLGDPDTHVDVEEDEIGPSLSPVSKCQPEDKPSDRDSDSSDSEDFGPQLPPKLGQSVVGSKPVSRVVGPTMPTQFSEHCYENEDARESDDDDDEIIGPALPTTKSSSLTAAQEFEERSKKMKNKLLGLDEDATKPFVREEWMMELPPEMTKNFGMGPRKFRQKAPEIGDRSGWTESPQDRANKNQDTSKQGVATKRPHDEMMDRMVSERDLAINKDVTQYNKTARSESLLDMHTKKKKKKAQETEDIPEGRRPFSREADLQTNKFDDAQKKSIIKKSQELNTRFSKGSGAKYL